MTEIRHIMIFLVIISGLLLGTAGFIGGITEKYNKPATNLSTISRLENVSQRISQTEQNITTTKLEGGTILDVAFSVVQGGFSVIKTLTSVTDIVSGMITDIVRLLRLPDWVWLMVITFVSILVVFEIISIAVKYRT